jgi:hypothetical protein
VLIPALGYRGLARFFSIHQPPEEDHVIIFDGYIRQLADPESWTMYLEHPANSMALSPYNLKGEHSIIPGDIPIHQLLIDTHKRVAYVGLADRVQSFLSVRKPEGWISRLDTKAQSRLEQLIEQTMREMNPKVAQEFWQKYELRARQLREKLRLSLDLLLRLN